MTLALTVRRPRASGWQIFCFYAVLVMLLGGWPAAAWPAVSESQAALADLLGKVHFYRLSNGMRVLMYRREVAPVFAGLVAVRVGGVDERPGITGISHMFEHMAFKGSSRLGTRNIRRERPLLAELEEIAARSDAFNDPAPADAKRWQQIYEELKDLWDDRSIIDEYRQLGANGLNATTGPELTNYFVSLPSAAFEHWCWLESERLKDPVMRQFYQERDVVLEEWRSRVEDDPRGRLYDLVRMTAFLEHPYRNPVIGYHYDISRLTATKLIDFRRIYYVPANIVLALVGDIEPERDIKVVERYFGNLPVGPPPPRPTAIEPEQNGERRAILRAEARPQLLVAYRKPVYPHPDDVALTLLGEILAGSSISPLHRDLVKKRRLATAVNYYEAPGQSYPNLALFAVGVRAPHSPAEALAAFDQVIAAFLRQGVSAEQLAIAQRSEAVAYLGNMQGNLALAKMLGWTEILYDDWQLLGRWYDEMMQVRVEDINRVAQLYLQETTRSIVELQPLSGGK